MEEICEICDFRAKKAMINAIDLDSFHLLTNFLLLDDNSELVFKFHVPVFFIYLFYFYLTTNFFTRSIFQCP